MRERLDQALVSRQLVASRSRARDLIGRGHVTVDGSITLKPAQTVRPDSAIGVDADAANQVSRGAVKLAAALEAFSFSPEDRRALDVGAATGGFTQTLLQAGAMSVDAVDVGRGQMHLTLENDPRVRVFEATDIRTFSADVLKAHSNSGSSVSPKTRGASADHFAAIVCDVSFISLLKVLPAILPLAAPNAWLVALIKPQFEVGKKHIGRGGIVRNEEAARSAVETIENWFCEQPGWRITGIIPSPICGADGNRETLLGAERAAVQD
ncbi:MAG: TlyA family RNA methyltransferase [Pseudomonadota bacterium]